MLPSTDKCSNNTFFSLDISLQDHTLPAKSPFKPSLNHPKNQAIINLIPQLDPNSHPSHSLPQDQEHADTDDSELTFDGQNSQNDSTIEEVLDPLAVKDLDNNTLSSANRQNEHTKGISRQFLVELDNMEEEKSLCFEDPQNLKKQQCVSLTKGEAKEQTFGLLSQEEQRKIDPLENYVKGRSCENLSMGIENPEETGDESLKSQMMKGSKKLYLSGGQMKTRKEIEAEMALERLESFDLSRLKTTKHHVPDMRYTESKEYKRLCESARLNPVEHCKENIVRFSQKSGSGNSTQADSNGYVGSQSSLKSERVMVKSQKEAGNKDMKRSQMRFRNEDISEEILAKIEEAKRKVGKYDISKIKFKKDQTPDRRYKQNREYVLLLEQCELSYYLKK